jgi:diaminopimelate epimerase
MNLSFTKLEALGNDFIVMEEQTLSEANYSRLAQDICERHFGVGADGLVFFGRSESPAGADFRMRIFNADGGEAEMSGNGLRCLAAHLYHQKLHQNPELKIETVSGMKQLKLVQADMAAYLFSVDMGKPILDFSKIPFQPDTTPGSLQKFLLPLGDGHLPVTITSMGNPHCSTFVNSFDELAWENVGPQIENHRFFPQRTNVEFIKVRSRHEIEVRFWERGVGKTLASGTGSCAATVASILNGLVDHSIRVLTLGGDLEMHWAPGESVRLKGPARFICAGEFSWTPGASHAS